MTKSEVQSRVLKEGKPLSKDLFSWDEKTNTFSSDVEGLVLDFREVSDCTFNTGSECTFKTGSYCTFNTGYDCIFKTGSYCTFETDDTCTFKTGLECVVVRRDVFEVIKLKEGVKIKLKNFGVKGYSVIEAPIKVETIKIGDTEYNKAEVEEALKNVKRLN